MGHVVLVEAGLCNDNRLHHVAVKQDPDHVLHVGLLADQEALVLNFRHENAIENHDKPPFFICKVNLHSNWSTMIFQTYQKGLETR